MILNFCNQCGTGIEHTMTCCPNCGACVGPESAEHQLSADPHEEQLRALLEMARSCAQTGDVATALCYAREALAQRSDCSTTHALLGQLYEQQGDTAAARYHFQAALSVTSSPVDAVSPSAPSAPTRQPQAGVMMLVLIGCILFSGLAALFAFRPSNHNSEQGTVQVIPKRHPLPEEPRWTWKVPATAPITAPASVQTSGTDDNTMRAAATDVGTSSTPPSTAGTPETISAPPEATVLGPSAHARSVVTISGKPSMEAADQAFFRGEYDKAVTLYEALLPTMENANPLIFHELALCYQQLGNSPKAAEYLEKAVKGYQELLVSDPNNITARQEMESCQSALHSLAVTRDHEGVQ